MKNAVVTEECFSSQCGHCSRCINAMHGMKGHDIPVTQIITHPEVIERFEKPRINDMTEAYLNKMIQDKHRETTEQYTDAYETYYGIFPHSYRLRESSFQESVYLKQESPHSLICDTPLCRAMYHSLPKYTQHSKYPYS